MGGLFIYFFFLGGGGAKGMLPPPPLPIKLLGGAGPLPSSYAYDLALSCAILQYFTTDHDTYMNSAYDLFAIAYDHSRQLCL